MISNYEKETKKAIRNLKAGMRFHEMLSYWVYILSVNKDTGVVQMRSHCGHPANPSAENVKFYRFPTLKTAKRFLKYNYYCDDLAFERMRKELLVTGKELDAGHTSVSKPRTWKMVLVEDE